MTCDKAASDGRLDSLIAANQQGCVWDKWTTMRAAEHGHFNCIKYLHEHGCPLHKGICRVAAERGDLECFKYVYDHGCPLDIDTCSAAAKGGHLDCLMFAHKHGFPWDEYTCVHAALNGHIECLKYAHENGCPWDDRAVAAAASAGRVDCLAYLFLNGCVWDPEKLSALCICFGQLDTLKFIHEEARGLIPENIAEGLLDSPCGRYALKHKTDEGLCRNPRCCIRQSRFLDINWNMHRSYVWEDNADTNAVKAVAAARLIARSMVRCWVDPSYEWCLRRLNRDFQTLIGMVPL